MKNEKPLSSADLFFKKMRMRFFSLYQTEFKAQLRIFLSCYDAKWEKGCIVDAEHTNYPVSQNQLTEEGYDSLKNDNDKLPMIWPDVYEKHSPLICIPDDADQSWLQSISMMCYRIEKISVKDYTALAKAYWNMNPIAPEYRKSYFEKTVANFKATKEFLVKYQVKDRCHFVMNEQCKPKNYVAPLVVKKGAVVRLKTGVATATVQADKLTFGNDTVHGACFLDKPLNGTRYWHKTDLVAISNP